MSYGKEYRTWEVLFQPDGTRVERVWHSRCHPDYAEPDNRFQACVLSAKQAIGHARNLPEAEYAAFREIISQALDRQRS